MSFLSRVFLVSILAAGSHLGCGDSTPGNEDRCSPDNPSGSCEGDELCHEGECLSEELLCSPEQEDGLCLASDEMCHEGECVAESELCSDENEDGLCPEGQQCIDGSCEPAQAPCSSEALDGYCDSDDEECIDGVCTSIEEVCSSEFPEGSCPDVEECREGGCVSTECSPENPEGRCPEDQTCDNGFCISDSPDCEPDGTSETRRRYENETVPLGQECVSEEQTRTCEEGSWSEWSGTYTFESCTPDEPADCDGGAHGEEQTRVRYEEDFIQQGEECNEETQTRVCDNGDWGDWSGTFTYDTCQVQEEDCTGEEQTRVRYREAEAPYGSECASEEQIRTCTGTEWSEWSGSFAAESCEVLPPADCDGVAHGEEQERTMYETSSVPWGEACSEESQTRACDNGVWSEWSGIFTAETCEVLQPADCDGVAHGEEQQRTMYETSSVPWGDTCNGESQTRSCDNGVWGEWTGTFVEESCMAETPLGCDGFPHDDIQTRLRYLAASALPGEDCESELQERVCTNGVWSEWSGAYTYPVCIVSGEDQAPRAALTVAASSSSAAVLDASGSWDAETPAEELEVRWDYDNDGVWDTDWSTTRVMHHSFGETGEYTVGVQVRDSAYQVDETHESVTLGGIQYVSGNVATTTWSGVVVVQGDVTVEDENILTIAPGTQVLLSSLGGTSLVGLRIDGHLDINGSVEHPGLFSVFGFTHREPGTWDGVEIYGTADIEYATFEYAGEALSISTEGDVNVSDSRFQLNEFGIRVRSRNSTTNFDSVSITNNVQTGVLIEGGSNQGSR